MAYQQSLGVIKRCVDRGVLPMAVVGVAVGGDIVDIQGVAAQPDDVVYLASISKPLVATMVMRMVARGEIALAEPLPARPELTWVHVLTHSSGLPEVAWPAALAARPREAAGLDTAATAPLLFTPGAAFSYSTLAFELLAHALEDSSGLDLESLLRRELTEPLAMVDTGFAPDRARAVAVEEITQGLDVTAREATDHLIALRLAGAGLWSTAEDLLRFGMGVLTAEHGQGLLPTWAVDVMGVNHAAGLVDAATGQLADQGIGWRRGRIAGRQLLPGRRILEHDGAAGSCLWLDRDAAMVVVILTSRLGAPAWAWQRAVTAAYVE